MSKLHPARTLPFRDLLDALRAARAERLVYEQMGPGGLRLYCYTNSCVYDAQWNDATLIARGLVLDVENETVVATPSTRRCRSSRPRPMTCRRTPRASSSASTTACG
ncbi:hypothetical protein RSO01_41920 [Reyranella soli]|uniref:Uncharacterized protein n=1 Tax=Reyranella soli TaxID=1230389 RepID=A0A512NDK3_9HYPH|nr:hypothetical protein RSO01_41920 [Reyranella soli]